MQRVGVLALMTSDSQPVRLSLKLDQEDAAQLDELCQSLPFATRHAVLVTAVRAGLSLLLRDPERIREFVRAKPNLSSRPLARPPQQALAAESPQCDEEAHNLEEIDTHEDDADPPIEAEPPRKRTRASDIV